MDEAKKSGAGCLSSSETKGHGGVSAKTSVRSWSLGFVEVWPPVLLAPPLALTAYHIIRPTVCGEALVESADENVLCFVSDGQMEIQITARVAYLLGFRDGHVVECEVERVVFDSAVFGAMAEKALTGVLARDATSVMRFVKRAPDKARDVAEFVTILGPRGGPASFLRQQFRVGRMAYNEHGVLEAITPDACLAEICQLLGFLPEKDMV
ncbi:MAG: hypothetical protein KGL39_01205 [Patescibacteria group bacterium]|nr:hypothetical protein [Patescibacteria group bacterium]